jgi:hypothetical protein
MNCQAHLQTKLLHCDITASSIQGHLKDSRLLLQSVPMESRSEIILMLEVAIRLLADVELSYVWIPSSYITKRLGF